MYLQAHEHFILENKNNARKPKWRSSVKTTQTGGIYSEGNVSITHGVYGREEDRLKV